MFGWGKKKAPPPTTGPPGMAPPAELDLAAIHRNVLAVAQDDDDAQVPDVDVDDVDENDAALLAE
jgi:hypothetical protein